MIRPIALVLGLALATAPALAQDAAAAPVAKVGHMLKDATGGRVGKIDKVLPDGSLRVIYNEQFVVVPAATVSFVDGEAVTSMPKRDIAKRR
jgi:hypothetical protein